MSMECRTDEESKVRKWDLFDVNKTTTTVYRHGTGIHQNFPHLGVQVNAGGSGILYANSTKMEDAGNYTCISDVKFSAQLIVFGRNCFTPFTLSNELATMTLTAEHMLVRRCIEGLAPSYLRELCCSTVTIQRRISLRSSA